jgi:Fic family protein
MAGLGFDLKLTAEVEAITEEALKSSEIEGEMLRRESVRSSVARRLGVPEAALAPEDRRVEGIVEITLDATKKFADRADARASLRLARGFIPYRLFGDAADQGGRLAPGFG